MFYHSKVGRSDVLEVIQHETWLIRNSARGFVLFCLISIMLNKSQTSE